MTNKRKNKLVSVSFSTIDMNRPKVDNVQLLEIDVELFNEYSKEDFATYVNQAAEKFWIQMCRGRLRSKLLAPKIVLSKESIGEYMSKAEKIIEAIESADEMEILEFDFDECFTYMRGMECAMNTFVDRVDAGEVRSTKTYNQFKKLLGV